LFGIFSEVFFEGEIMTFALEWSGRTGLKAVERCRSQSSAFEHRRARSNEIERNRTLTIGNHALDHNRTPSSAVDQNRALSNIVEHGRSASINSQKFDKSNDSRGKRVGRHVCLSGMFHLLTFEENGGYNQVRRNDPLRRSGRPSSNRTFGGRNMKYNVWKQSLMFGALGTSLLGTVPQALGQATLISASNRNIQYHGRFDFEDPSNVDFIWAGNQVVTRFTGTSVGVRLREGFSSNGRYYAIVNEDFANPVLLQWGDAVSGGTRNNGDVDLPIASGLANGTHTVRLVRLGSYYKSATTFKGFRVDTGASLVAPPAMPTRRIEFWGDSITEGTFQPAPVDENGFNSFASKASRQLNAAQTTVSRSGMGLFAGYQLPATMKTLNTNTTSGDKTPKWNFQHQAANQPHLLVINIGQNDFWTAKSTATATLVGHWTDMLNVARQAHPNAHILMTTGGMDMGKTTDSEAIRWRGAINTAVANFNDPRVSRFDFGEVAVGRHPHDAETTIMANMLVNHIDTNLNSVWNSTAPLITRVNAEDLTPTGIATSLENQPGAHGGAVTRVNATAAGQGVTFSLDATTASLAPGEYDVRVWLRADRDHGFVDVSLNGALIADNLNTYRTLDDRNAAHYVLATTRMSVTGAPLSLQLSSAGANPINATSTSAFAIDSVEFVPAIPEPTSLMGLGLAGAMLLRRRRAASASRSGSRTRAIGGNVA
jgi:Carbohydrate esterase 2 N-terminal/GDSL-like Lipase/Acylhydrolase family/PEP-CTERM motif